MKRILTFAMMTGTGLFGAVNVADFGARPDGSDTTPAVRAALDHCRKTKASRMVFPPGRYDFWPDRAVEKYLYISNNDEGLKRIAFPLSGIANLEIDGQGAQFHFHGGINPFVLERSSNITLKNFSIDWKRTFHNEARVLAVRDDGVEIEIPEQFAFKVEKGLLQFSGENKEPVPIGSLLEFDTAKRETAYMARDYYTGANVQAVATGPRRVRISVPRLTATPGNTLVFGASHRNFPAITITDSRGVKIAGVNIYHCGGMGVIAQRSADLELDHVQVTPSPNSGRIISITADATHFVNCSGRIRMTDCLFENQKDDATNIHGIYAQVTKRVGPREIEVKLVHQQQFGFDFIEPGMKLEFVHGKSMVTYGETVVRSVNRLNKEYTQVVLQSPLPDALKAGDVVASAAGNPDVVIRNCVIRNNRARGLLLGSRGKILIEENTFHVPGAAILLEGDARFWFEQAGVRDLVIRRNRFENCNFGVWGKSVIQVGAGIEVAERSASRYNRNIPLRTMYFACLTRPRWCSRTLSGV